MTNNNELIPKVITPIQETQYLNEETFIKDSTGQRNPFPYSMIDKLPVELMLRIFYLCLPKLEPGCYPTPREVWTARGKLAATCQN